MNKVVRLPLDGIHILTTDPEKRIGLYAIRYLGRAGAYVTGVAEESDLSQPIGFFSKYVNSKKYFRKETYFDQLKDFLVRNSSRYDVINPIDISKMLCVIDTDNEYNLNCNYLLPNRESLVIADNKELLTKHAQKIGLSCPKTLFGINPDLIKDVCSEELSYPCIIKFRGDKRDTHWKPEERYSIVSTPDMLSSEYLRMHEIEKFPVVQEYIYGRGFGYFALFDKKHNLKAQFCHKRIREYPITGGPSSCCESFYDPELLSIGRKLLDSLEWTGLGMVEFKYDEIRKQYFIIEVNPRYWGSLPLAVYSGVNFPVLHALSALNVDYEAVLDYRVGLKTRFFHNDVKSIFKEIYSEKHLKRKIRLFFEIFNPTIRDGFIVPDDINPFLQSVMSEIKQIF